MKKLNAFLLALITVVFSSASHAQINQGQARNFQINETHTGATYAAGLTPPLKQKWTVNFGQSISYPLIADGRVFVTVRNASAYGSKLYALDAASGATVWSFALGGVYYWSALCYENGRVFAINGDGLLRAFDAADGNVVWSRQLPGQYSFSSAPTVFQGVIYTGGSGSGGTAYAVSADTGNVLWTVPVSGGSQSSPAVTQDGVYLSYSCPNVYKLNPVNGALIWRYSPNCSGGGGKTPVLYNGRLYVRDYNPDYIFDSETGGMAGSFISKHAPAFSGNMGFFLNGSKGFGSFGVLEGRDVNNNNSLVWSFAGDGFLQSSMLVVNDYVYVGSDKGKLYAVEAATGQQVWSTNAGTGIPYVDEHNVSQPLTGFAAGEGILVVPTKTTLVAYEADHAPTITWGDKVPAANAYGWNNAPVEVQFTASAHPAGVTFSTPGSPIQFSSEGANQTQQVTVSDQAGNTATFTSPIVNVDWTAPVTTRALSATSGNDGWYTSAVQVSLSASDSLSGIKVTNYQLDGGATQTYLGPFSISSDGNHSVFYWSSDAAGNIEPQQSFGVLVDVNPPTTQAAVSGTATGNGWYQAPAQVTLTASDGASGVANTYYTVDGGTTQTYSGPFSVSNEGSHVINYWSVDMAGKAENPRSVIVKVDLSAPTTQLSVSGTPGNNGWYRSPTVQVSLTASDSQAGTANTFYTVDGGTIQTYAGAFTLTGNARHNVTFWSVDSVGNTEAVKSANVNIDNVGPTTQNAVTGPAGGNNYFKGPIQMSLTASDNLSGIENIYYRIDSGATQTYAGPFTVSGDGTHLVTFWSVDVAGNNNSSGGSNIRIDSTAPVTQATVAGSSIIDGWYSGPVQVTLAASDNLSGMFNSYYRIDGGSIQTYSSPFTISTTGTHTVLFWSWDLANNMEVQQSIVVKVDVGAPVTQASVSGNTGNGWYQDGAQVSLTASDSSSGVANSYYTVDGGAAQTYTSPFSVAGAGEHIVNYWSVDAVGNIETQKSVTIKIDTSAPSTQLSANGTAGNNGWYRSATQVTLTGSDSQAGVANTFYSVDGGSTQTYLGQFTVSGDGQHQVSFWSVDKVGNSETHQTILVKIDSTGPTTQNAVSGPAGNSTYFRGAVLFSLTAVDNGSGVATTYYRIDGGPNQTYTAPFTVSGDGTHPVDFWSVDVAGNNTYSYTSMIRIDGTPPLTASNASGTMGTNGWYRGPVQMSLSASDNLSGVANVYYNVDGGPTQTFATAFTVSTTGAHTINYWSIDQANNTESSRSMSVNIDGTGPMITASATPSTANKSNKLLSVTVSGGVTDAPSGVKPNSTTYSVVDEYGVTQPSGSVTLQADGSYSFKLTLPATRNGGDSNGHLYTITIRADDQAGNQSAASTTVKIL